jgi:hypothetical protein
MIVPAGYPVKWEKPGLEVGDEAGIRGLGMALGAESFYIRPPRNESPGGDSVAPDARRFTAGCPPAIPAGTGQVLAAER